MTKSKFKKAIKQMMINYKFTLEQACWSMKQMNPNWVLMLNDVELELTTDQLLGKF